MITQLGHSFHHFIVGDVVVVVVGRKSPKHTHQITNRRKLWSMVLVKVMNIYYHIVQQCKRNELLLFGDWIHSIAHSYTEMNHFLSINISGRSFHLFTANDFTRSKFGGRFMIFVHRQFHVYTYLRHFPQTRGVRRCVLSHSSRSVRATWYLFIRKVDAGGEHTHTHTHRGQQMSKQNTNINFSSPLFHLLHHTLSSYVAPCNEPCSEHFRHSPNGKFISIQYGRTQNAQISRALRANETNGKNIKWEFYRLWTWFIHLFILLIIISWTRNTFKPTESSSGGNSIKREPLSVKMLIY